MAASKLSLLLLAAAATSVQAACSNTLGPNYKPAVLAPGFKATVIAANLTEPRAIVFDSNGNMLVAQNAAGIMHLTLKDEGGACVSTVAKKQISTNPGVTHSLDISDDGKTVYVTDVENLYAIPYDAASISLSDTNTTLVTGMTGTDHISRTMMWSKFKPGTVLINRGSFDNVDLEAADINSGHSNIRAFDTTKGAAQTFLKGTQVSWGTRNSVGITEHPITGGIYSVENSVDQMERQKKDIHENNPGEEMNFHGYLNGTQHPNFGGNFGYPYCFAAWDVADIPSNAGLKVGSNFAIDSANSTYYNDEFCKTQTISPRLTFPSHWAPLDIKFNPTGTTAWVTAHGSWNRDSPAGYQLVAVGFNPKTGEPLAPSTSQNHWTPIMQNGAVGDCPSDCFRPVSLLWDKKGRLFFSSDFSNEIIMITKEDGSGVADYNAPVEYTAGAAAAPAATHSARSLGGMEMANARRAVAAAMGAGAYGFAL